MMNHFENYKNFIKTTKEKKRRKFDSEESALDSSYCLIFYHKDYGQIIFTKYKDTEKIESIGSGKFKNAANFSIRFSRLKPSVKKLNNEDFIVVIKVTDNEGFCISPYEGWSFKCQNNTYFVNPDSFLLFVYKDVDGGTVVLASGNINAAPDKGVLIYSSRDRTIRTIFSVLSFGMTMPNVVKHSLMKLPDILKIKKINQKGWN